MRLRLPPGHYLRRCCASCGTRSGRRSTALRLAQAVQSAAGTDVGSPAGTHRSAKACSCAAEEAYVKIDADAAGFDPKRLERITEHLARRYIEPQKISGCQTAVVRHGEVGYFSSLGSMDLERGRPVREDTIWRIYSMTKPITGVALMTLYERGHFQLGDPVHRFIPEWNDLKVAERQPDGSTRLVEAERPMSVGDALMHMTGLGWGVD